MKKIFLLALILFSGCVTDQAEKAGIGDVVTVNYTGWLLNGTEFNSGEFTFTMGSGRVISGFEDAIIGMQVGESKTVTLPPEQAYGIYDDTPISMDYETLNKSVYNSVDINAEVGVLVYVVDANDEQILYRIIGIENGLATLKKAKTHELQGETLVFRIDLIRIG